MPEAERKLEDAGVGKDGAEQRQVPELPPGISRGPGEARSFSLKPAPGQAGV